MSAMTPKVGSLARTLSSRPALERTTLPPVTLSRQVALGAAELTFGALVRRAHTLSNDPGYVEAMAVTWIAKLRSLAMFRTNATLRDETAAALEQLTAAVNRVPDDDVDGLLRWLDAFPGAVSQLFPPSESTFHVEVKTPRPASPTATSDEAWAVAA